MPIVDIGDPAYVKASPKFVLVSDPTSTVSAGDKLITGEPYLLTDSSAPKDDDGNSPLDQFSCLVLDKAALEQYCGTEIFALWDKAAKLVSGAQDKLPGISTDHVFVKHLGIIMQEDSADPCIAIEEEDNTPDRVALQQSILEAFGELMTRILLGVAKRLFVTNGYEDIATQVDYMAHVLKRRHFPCFGTEANAWFNNLTLHTSTQIQDLTRDRANLNGAVPMPALFITGSARVYLSRYAKIFEAEPYSVLLVSGAEQVVVSASPSGQKERLVAFGRCEEDVFNHYAQYDTMNQLRDRLAQEMKA